MSARPRPDHWFAVCVALLATMTAFPRAMAHEEPTSFLELRINGDAVLATLTASATDLAHDLPTVEADMLLTAGTADAQRSAIAEILRPRLTLIADGVPLAAELSRVTPVPDKRDLRLEFHCPWAGPPAALAVRCGLFPYDPRHRTFLSIYENGRLERQEILRDASRSVQFRPGSTQAVGAVLHQFVLAGIHHIFIGPDHILFVVGLLLLGGTVVQLLKIVTAFTIAHSLTLGLATFGLVTPPSAVIEPAIALSIVSVGLHAFLGGQRRDPRLILAFAFGLIHGFGFASVLREMVLPRAALGWSLFAFNAGVEIGQACIVAAVAPVLALIHRWNRLAGARIVTAGALAVTVAGMFWFFQRIIA